MTRFLTATGAAGLALCTAAAMAQTAPAVQTYGADILGAEGKPIGRIAVRDGANALVMRVTIEPGGLAPGWHGLHFHAIGDCSDPGKFEKSKAHVNHDNAKHGLLYPEGPDEGDLPNILANADGSANAEVTSDTPARGLSVSSGIHAALRRGGPARQRRVRAHHPRRRGRSHHAADRQCRGEGGLRGDQVAPGGVTARRPRTASQAAERRRPTSTSRDWISAAGRGRLIR